MVQQRGQGQRQEEEPRKAISNRVIDASTAPTRPLVLQYGLQLACRPVYPIPPSLCTMLCYVSYVTFCYYMFHFDLFRLWITSPPQHAAYCTPWPSRAGTRHCHCHCPCHYPWDQARQRFCIPSYSAYFQLSGNIFIIAQWSNRDCFNFNLSYLFSCYFTLCYLVLSYSFYYHDPTTHDKAAP